MAHHLPIMKRHPFNANEADENRLRALTKKLGLSVTAVIREAIRLLHKKEIENVSKVLLVVALCIAAASCGTAQTIMPQDGPSDPTPTPTPIATPSPSPTPKPIICSHGLATDPGGIMCDQGTEHDPDYYQHWQWQVAMRPDGHGTFSAITETGIKQTSTRYIGFDFPQTISLAEVHGTLTITSWCSGLGAVTFWNGANTNGPLEQIVSAKSFTFNINDEPTFSYPQIVFPVNIPLKQLYLFSSTDLCAVGTIHWTLNGSF